MTIITSGKGFWGIRFEFATMKPEFLCLSDFRDGRELLAFAFPDFEIPAAKRRSDLFTNAACGESEGAASLRQKKPRSEQLFRWR